LGILYDVLGVIKMEGSGKGIGIDEAGKNGEKEEDSPGLRQKACKRYGLGLLSRDLQRLLLFFLAGLAHKNYYRSHA
jgi:hypothetical protein